MKLKCAITDNVSNKKKAFQVLNEMQMTSTVNTIEDNDHDRTEKAIKAVLNDKELWNDLECADQDIVDEVINQHTTERLACYAHMQQLTIKDGLGKLDT